MNKSEQKKGGTGVVFANAKINIGLKIRGKRNDGYHNIETVMYPVPLYDVMEWNVSEKFSVETYGTEKNFLKKGEKNLVEKAYGLLKQKFAIPPLKVCLLKNIPAGSGLGGGSADAVFFIKSVNRVLGLGMNNKEMEKLSLNIGSDCPFFAENKPAFVSGRGEKLIKLRDFLKGYCIFLVFPDFKTETVNMYNKIQDYGEPLNIEKIINSHPSQWKDFAVNDFEKILSKEYPLMVTIKERLYKSGALYCSLTGSGSAVYGIFENCESLPDTDFPAAYFTFKSIL